MAEPATIFVGLSGRTFTIPTAEFPMTLSSLLHILGVSPIAMHVQAIVFSTQDGGKVLVDTSMDFQLSVSHSIALLFRRDLLSAFNKMTGYRPPNGDVSGSMHTCQLQVKAATILSNHTIACLQDCRTLAQRLRLDIVKFESSLNECRQIELPALLFPVEGATHIHHLLDLESVRQLNDRCKSTIMNMSRCLDDVVKECDAQSHRFDSSTKSSLELQVAKTANARSKETWDLVASTGIDMVEQIRNESKVHLAWYVASMDTLEAQLHLRDSVQQQLNILARVQRISEAYDWATTLAKQRLFLFSAAHRCHLHALEALEPMRTELEKKLVAARNDERLNWLPRGTFPGLFCPVVFSSPSDGLSIALRSHGVISENEISDETDSLLLDKRRGRNDEDSVVADLISTTEVLRTQISLLQEDKLNLQSEIVALRAERSSRHPRK